MKKLSRQPAIERHVAVITAGQITRSLYEYGFTCGNRFDEPGDLGGSILVVAGHDHANVVATFSGPAISCANGSSRSASLWMLNEHRTLLHDDFGRAIGGAVIKHGHIYSLDFSEAIEHGADLEFFIKRDRNGYYAR